MSSSENFDPGRIKTDKPRIFGVKITTTSDDPFQLLIGEEWQTTRWYATREERDRAILQLGTRHMYSRIGDIPSLNYEPVEADPVGKPQIGGS